MSDICLFVGYPKGTKGYLFYDPKEQRVLVSTNTHFLKQDYMLDNKCYVLGLTSALSLAWLADTSQTLAKNTG